MLVRNPVIANFSLPRFLAPGDKVFPRLFLRNIDGPLGEYVPQIGRALSLVPAEVRTLQALSALHYMELDHVIDPTYVPPGRKLDRPQMELIAARVSAINECFY